MKFLSRFYRLGHRSVSGPSRQGRPRASRPTASFRPQLEALEDRCLLSAGALDPTFNPGGSPPGTEVYSPGTQASAVAGYPGTDTTGNANKIVVVGSQWYQISNGEWHDRMAVARFNPDGSPDTTFNKTGIEYLSFSKNRSAGSNATSVAIQPDGKIVVAGTSTVNGVKDFAVARFDANGSLDTTFNKTGYVQTNVSGSGNNEANSLVLQPDGKIVVAGRTVSGSNYVSAIVRYTASGALDATWGKKGIDILSIGASGSWFNAVALENGQVVAAGQAAAANSVSGFDLARFTATGALDPSFGANGIVMTPPAGDAGDSAHALAVQADGKLVVGGEVDNNVTDGNGNVYVVSSFALGRYNTDGTLDTSFNGTGRVTLPPGNIQTNLFTAVLYQPADGKIVAVGYEESVDESIGGFAVARFNPDGSADTTFGSNGMTTTYFGDSSLGSPFTSGAALQSDGRIVVVGGARQSSGFEGWSWGLARYLASDPEIGSFTATPNPVTSGSNVTLTASNITDGNPNSYITQVTFYYYDINGNKVVLGNGTKDSSGDWTLTFAVNLASGTYTLYAQAEDNYGVLGDPDALTLTVQ